MKTMLKPKLTAFLCAGLCVFASASDAQETKTPTIEKPQVTKRAAEVADKANGTNVRASQLIGMKVENSAEENIGEINDMVINAAKGGIRYLTMTYGESLGLGNEMHAVPFGAFKFKTDLDDSTDTALILNVTAEQLKGAKGFNEKNWPNFSNDELNRSIQQRYEVQRTPGSDSNTGSAKSPDADRDRNTNTRRNQKDQAAKTGSLEGKTHVTNMRASQLIGLSIENSAKNNVGTLNDIVVDARNGRIRYAVVSYGGFLGIGNGLHAVPFESIKCKANPDDASKTMLVLDVTQEQMKGAKGFDESNWPDFASKEFTRDIDKRYGIDRKSESTTQAVDPANTGVNVRDRNSSTKTSVDQNENQKDIDITAKIRKQVVGTKMSTNAKNVKIITQAGQVTLRGPVNSADEKTQIEKLAQKVAGPKNVSNQLEVQP